MDASEGKMSGGSASGRWGRKIRYTMTTKSIWKHGRWRWLLRESIAVGLFVSTRNRGSSMK